MAQTTGRVPIPTMRRTDTARFGGIQQVGPSSWSNAPTMRFGQESMRVGGPRGGYGGGGLRSFASRDPVSALANRRRGIASAGRRFWGRGGPPTSRRSPSLSERFYGNRVPGTNIVSTGFGGNRPKTLAMRRFTSKWISGGPGQLLQPNPSYMGGSGRFNPEQAFRQGFGRMPGTYAARRGQMGMRATV